ncbi:hypothetical protein TrRE_jg7887, partial [Triparma retinervis]
MPMPLQLGYLDFTPPTNPFLTPYLDWDGGKVGGRPHTLSPSPIPSSSCLCTSCNKVCVFLLQLYAPCDSSPTLPPRPWAYHRMLYLLLCPTPGCLGGVLLRETLPRDNPHLPYEGDEEP